METQTSRNNEIVAEATNEVLAEKPDAVNNLEDFLNRVSKKFIEKKLEDFPRMCQVARVQNKIKLDELRNNSKSGKYTDSLGWSEDRSFKFEFEIPEDLYIFMINLVYKKFWNDDNSKVWRAFMNAICRGDDSIQTLMKVKTLYGPNSDGSLTA